MKYSIVPLKKENDLNKILKVQKNSEEDIHILFLSLWDDFSSKLEKRIKKKYSRKNPHAQKVYVVDSFNMPHSFVIFNTTKVPCLVSLEKGKVVIEDYLPRIYKKFRI